MAFTQPLEHSRRVRACCFSSPHAPGWDAPIPETRDKGRAPAWRLVQGPGDGVWWCPGGRLCGWRGNKALGACGSLLPELEPESCFVFGETVPHGVTCLSLFASPWRPWGPGEATAPRGPRPREERGGHRGHDFRLHSAPLPTYGFPPAGSSVFQKFLLVTVTSSSGLDLAELWGLEGRAVPRLGARGFA